MSYNYLKPLKVVGNISVKEIYNLYPDLQKKFKSFRHLAMFLKKQGFTVFGNILGSSDIYYDPLSLRVSKALKKGRKYGQ